MIIKSYKFHPPLSTQLISWFLSAFLFILIQKYITNHYSLKETFLPFDLLFGFAIGGWFAVMKKSINWKLLSSFAIFLAIIFANSNYIFPFPLDIKLGWNIILSSISMFCLINGLLIFPNSSTRVFRAVVVTTLIAITPLLILLFYGLAVEFSPFGHKFGKSDGFVMMLMGTITEIIVFFVGIFWIFKIKE